MQSNRRALLPTLLVAVLSVLAPKAIADFCPDGNAFGSRMFESICWDCIFPLKIMGTSLDMGTDTTAQAPPDESPGGVLCSCKDNQGVPRPGIKMGMWSPARLVEVVRAPFCSVSLGGIRIQDTYRGFGGRSQHAEADLQRSFYQVHLYSYPLMVMLDLFVDADCNPDGYMDMDLMYITEYDPTWISDELALVVNFETMIFANPIAQAACLADAGASMTTAKGIEAMHWCAGTWGPLHPLTGNRNNSSSPPEATSMMAAKLMGLMHRRGLSKKTTGEGSMCRAQIFPTLPKQQYKLGMFYPLAETKSNHWIGQSSYTWGEWRNVPAAGEDHVYTLYRWVDCCLRY